jgi:hypothetical protein
VILNRKEGFARIVMSLSTLIISRPTRLSTTLASILLSLRIAFPAWRVSRQRNRLGWGLIRAWPGGVEWPPGEREGVACLLLGFTLRVDVFG